MKLNRIGYCLALDETAAFTVDRWQVEVETDSGVDRAFYQM